MNLKLDEANARVEDLEGECDDLDEKNQELNEAFDESKRILFTWQEERDKMYDENARLESLNNDKVKHIDDLSNKNHRLMLKLSVLMMEVERNYIKQHGDVGHIDPEEKAQDQARPQRRARDGSGRQVGSGRNSMMGGGTRENSSRHIGESGLVHEVHGHDGGHGHGVDGHDHKHAERKERKKLVID